MAKGFAAMPQEKVREIAKRGGKAAHAKGCAHEWTRTEAQAAGRKGGLASNGGLGKDCTCPRDEDGFVVWSLTCPRVRHIARAIKAAKETA